VNVAGNSESQTQHLLSNPSIRLGSLAFTFLMLLFAAYVAYLTVVRMRASLDLVLHSYTVRGQLQNLREDVDKMRAEVDSYLLFKNQLEAIEFEQQSRQEQDTLEKVRNLTRDNQAQQSRLIELKRLLDEERSQLKACLGNDACVPRQMQAGLDFVSTWADRRSQIRESLTSMEDEEESLLRERLNSWNRLFTRMVWVVALVFGIALLFIAYNFRLLLEEIARRERREAAERENTESYRALSARILELQDVERRRIARELHDSVGQYLTGLKLNLGRLRSRYPDSTDSQLLLSETVTLTDHAITEVRTISHLLHPPLLDELGFYSATRWYAEGFAKRSGIQIELKLDDVVERLPKEIELALFRVLQEALTNVHRHAKARRVNIEVTCKNEVVELIVKDDGSGIARAVLERFRSGQAGGIGLAGMRERLAELNGHLEVQSGVSGTTVRATVPTKACGIPANNSEIAAQSNL
jgi:signal transduction histidine kinase